MDSAEILKALSMLPGIHLSSRWLFHMPQTISVWGYMLTCCTSFIYHFHSAVCTKSGKYLRLDLLGQNIGLLSGLATSPYGKTSPLILLPLTSISFLADLENKKERMLAFYVQALNILTAFSFSYRLVIGWLIGFGFWHFGRIFKSGLANVAWHFMSHININRYFEMLWVQML
jgi:hypothetical protein